MRSKGAGAGEGERRAATHPDNCGCADSGRARPSQSGMWGQVGLQYLHVARGEAVRTGLQTALKSSKWSGDRVNIHATHTK